MTSTPPSEVWSNGTKCWYRNGELHRDGDKPAFVAGDGSIAWYRRGEYQRSLQSDGTMFLWPPTRQHRMSHFEPGSLRYKFVRLHLTQTGM